MTSKQYEKLSAPFRSRSMTRLLKAANIFITAAGYTAYPIILLYFFLYNRERVIAAVVVPASGFILLTAIRRKINRPRPYQMLDINPIIHKNKQGKSMPSRHVFSMGIIAMTGFLLSPVIGYILIVLSICLAITRVIGGVHYPSDVIAGLISAIIWGGIWYSLIL